MFLKSIRLGLRVSLSGGLLIFVFGILAIHYLATPSTISFLSFLIFLPAIFSPAGGYDFEALVHGCRSGIVAGLVLICAAALLAPATLFGPCRLDKCSLWGQALGPYGTGNALGMVVALAGAVSLIAVATWPSFVMIAVSSIIIVDMTSGRSALYSWFFCALIAAAFQISRRVGRRVYVSLAAMSVAAVAIGFTFLNWSDTDFTERGSLWAYARQVIEENPWFGYGSSFWVRDDGLTGVPLNYSTHNWFLEMLVSVGVVGVVALLAAMVSSSVSRFGFSTGVYATALTGFVFAMSVTEVFSAPGRTYLMTGLAVLAFVIGESVSREANGAIMSESQEAVMASNLR
ncbi:O-antigen ligase family protein [Microbacterium testaceum]|uniref:O-antigen ligase family protein n=1 Tax=Microbacterium testaceum TaxID=2033 RepID=UPI001FA71984|nr:O-antigen ligase family protein [Microbacterium testaceum]